MESPSLLGFLIDLAQAVFGSNGNQEDLYDINFSNHYKSLYDFKQECDNEGVDANIEKVVQDRKTKSIRVDFKNSLNLKKNDQLIDYCDQNKIDYDISKGKIRNITITRNSNGVLEERKWKKGM